MLSTLILLLFSCDLATKSKVFIKTKPNFFFKNLGKNDVDKIVWLFELVSMKRMFYYKKSITSFIDEIIKNFWLAKNSFLSKLLSFL